MDVFSQIRPVSLREQVAEQIRTAIIEGQLRPGDHIVESTLTEQLGVSRTPVREALILLEREGLVVALPNRGSFVRSFTEGDIDTIFSMRTTLENFAGELIIERLTQDDYDYMRDSISLQYAAISEGNFKNVRSIDMAFHRHLVQRSQHPLLARSWTEIVAQIAALLYVRADAGEYDEYRAIRDHELIYDAYVRRALDTLRQLNEQINQRVADECKLAVRQAANGVRRPVPD
jgi:DNA-binding GntR family transcriptional regulator